MIAKVKEVALMGAFQEVAHPGMVVEVVVCEPDCPHTQIIVSPHAAFVLAGLNALAPTVIGMMAAWDKVAAKQNKRIV